MMNTHASLRTVLLLGLVLSLAGCGNSVLGPDPTGGGGNVGTEPLAGPEILMITESQSVRYVRLSAELADGTSMPATGRALHVSAVIDGEAGGRLQCGRFLLSIPPGAFEGEGTISMSMPDSTIMIVDLEIDPVELNDFKEPVKLCLLTDGTILQEEDLQIYWWDPDQAEWKGMYCDNDLSEEETGTGTLEGLITHLSHFSRYSGGKAGW